jgi:hypothetical protein
MRRLPSTRGRTIAPMPLPEGWRFKINELRRRRRRLSPATRQDPIH